MPIDLAVVMPVYNEEACIVDVVRSWHAMLSTLNIQYRIIILNDGSTDGTKKALEAFNHIDSIEVVNKKNSGHGPTILMGYKKAVELAEWVFQCDSDDEMKSDYFLLLWEKRQQFDALFGLRENRRQNISRKIITFFSILTVRLVFGKGVTDVNTPFRLIRSDILRKIISQLPDHTMPANIIISGALSKHKVRIYEYPVPHENRRTGQVSIVKFKLWKTAIRCFWQTLFCRPVINVTNNGSKTSR